MNRKELNSYRGNGTRLCFTCCMPQCTDSFFEDSENEEILSITSDADSIPDSLEWFSRNISSYYRSNIKIAHFNINSIQNKLDEVKDILNRNMFDTLFIDEMKLDGMYSSSLLYHPGYRIVRETGKKGTGGLIAFIREDLSAYREFCQCASQRASEPNVRALRHDTTRSLLQSFLTQSYLAMRAMRWIVQGL